MLSMSPDCGSSIRVGVHRHTNHTSSALKTSMAACVPDLAPSHCSALGSLGLTKRWKVWSFSSEAFPGAMSPVTSGVDALLAAYLLPQLHPVH